MQKFVKSILLVAAFLLFGRIATSEDAIVRTHSFPIFALFDIGSGFYVHEPGAKEVLMETDMTLQRMRENCEGFNFIEIDGCDKFYCFNNGSKEKVNFISNSKMPAFTGNLCPKKTLDLFGANVTRNQKKRVNTIYPVKENFDIAKEFLPLDLHYCGCISVETFHQFEAGETTDLTASNTFTVQFSKDNGFKWTTILDDLRVRVWDIGLYCEAKLFPPLDFAAPLIKLEEDKVGYPLYSKKNCSVFRNIPTGPRNDMNVPTVIDETFFNSNHFCIDSLSLQSDRLNFELYKSTSTCIEAGQGFDVVFISSTECLMYNYDYISPHSLRITNDCLPCEDNPELLCGSDTSYSVHLLNEPEKEFVYFQCTIEDLYNLPEDVLNEDFYYINDTNLRPYDCLLECKKRNHNRHNFAMLTSHESRPENGLECTCLSNYKFSERESWNRKDSECYKYWCPRLNGPCLDHEGSTVGFSVVYCLNEDLPCDFSNFTSIADQHNICKLYDEFWYENEKYKYVCNSSNETGRHRWSKIEKPEYCQENVTGTEWIGDLNHTVPKDCGPGYLGEQTWFCNSNGKFVDQPDRSECLEKWIDNVDEDIANGIRPSSDIADQINNNLKNETNLTTAGLKNLSTTFDNLMKLRRQQFDDCSFNQTEIDTNFNFTTTFINNTELIYTKDETWNSIEDQSLKSKLMSDYIDIGNRAGFLYLYIESSNNQSNNFSYEGNKIKVEVRFEDKEDNPPIKFGDEFVTINIPDGVRDIEGDEGEYGFNDTLAYVGTAFNFREYNNRFPDGYTVDGENRTGESAKNFLDFSLTFKNKVELPFGRKVELTFQHRELLESETSRCIFWNNDINYWDGEGCIVNVNKSHKTQTVCLCDHLTTFSLIFGNFGNPKSEVMNILSQVLAGISVFALFLTQIYIISFKSSNDMRRNVEVNRNLSLMLGMILFVFMSDWHLITENPNVCTAVTFISHFWWLSAFTWTALEGYLLYRALVVVFDTGDQKIFLLYVFGYGIPALVTIITFGTALIISESSESDSTSTSCQGYCDSEICWLNLDYIWGFVGPLAFVLIYNLFILITGLRIAKKATERKGLTSMKKVKTWARNCIVLTFLLGLPWMVGYLQYIGNGDWAWLDYAFIILNAPIGLFIFFYKVILSRSFQDASRKILQRTSTFATKSTRLNNNPQQSDQSQQRKRTKSTGLSDGGVAIIGTDGGSSGYGSDHFKEASSTTSDSPSIQPRPRRWRNN